MASGPNPFERVARTLEIDGQSYKYYSLPELNDARVGTCSSIVIASRSASNRIESNRIESRVGLLAGWLVGLFACLLTDSMNA